MNVSRLRWRVQRAWRKWRGGIDLVYAATSRCPCGAGMAYDRIGVSGNPLRGYWDCSAILLGTAIASGESGSTQHTAQLPFVFWEIKSENQPSARGATTREKAA